MSKEEYASLVEKKSPNSPTPVNCLKAFLAGGLICVLGQALRALFVHLGAEEETAATAVSVTLVFLGAFLTGVGIYDKLAKHAGAGTLVPITGFANSVAAPAMEHKADGYVTGLAAKTFIIAGPVIVFGTLASVVYGIVLVVYRMM